MSNDFPDFPALYRQVTGRDPFPWQTALAARVATGDWPEAVTVPTGLGKTTTVHVAVWNLARQMHRGGERTAPVRMLHIVDRTTIVDQTHGDIAALAEVLASAPPDSPAGVVAQALRTGFGLAAGDEVLLTGRVHGTHRDNGWTAAHRPVVVTMTAHQAVSRALFRGFGVSPGMAPVHAALVGMDSLLLVDEPHLSTAAVPTLAAVKQLQGSYEPVGVPVGQVVALGATLPHTPASTVGVSHDDRQHPVAGARLRGEKTLTRHTARSATEPQVRATVTAVAKRDLEQYPDRPVAVVCNTVATARQVHAALTENKGAVTVNEALLVTSRIRGWERARLNDQLAGPLPRLVVATQTVEAGMDLSVPTMVTEVCGWQALTQRAGRVNRYGAEAGRLHVVTTVRPETTLVYGDTAGHTAGLLSTLGDGADLSPEGLEAIREHHPQAVAAAVGTSPYSPVLHPGMLPTLSHTRPRPAADVDVQPYITGVTGERAADVQVLWRDEPDPTVLAGMPPSRPEQVTVPLSALRQLLHRAATGAVSAKSPGMADAAGSEPSPDTSSYMLPDPEQVPVWVRSSTGWTVVSTAADLTPGSTVALPGWIGGHDHTGFTPQATDPVTDLAPVLAVDTGRWWLATPASLATLHQHGRVSTVPSADAWAEIGSEVDPADLPELARELLPPELAGYTVGHVHGRGLWLRAPTREQATSGLVPLADHAAQVAATVDTWAATLGLPDDLRGAAAWAGWHHDDGKTDPAFQVTLGAGTTPLAKEHPAGPGPSAAVPTRWRHEALSALQAHQQGHSDLTVHLIAAHHGWARPLLPPADGPGQQFTNHTRFAQLTRNYGSWGLAWVETLVRLADHDASATPAPHNGPPAVAAPGRRHDGSPEVERQDTVLAGITVDSHMAWWAAAGALAAAATVDPQATIRFDPAGTPTVTSSLDAEGIARAVLDLREATRDLSRLVPLDVAADRVDVEQVRAALANSSGTVAAALLCDTQPPDHRGRVDLRVPWHHNNSRLIATVWRGEHTPNDIADVLLSDKPAQHDDAGHYGLTGDPTRPVAVTGIRPSVRSGLLPLVLAAAVSLPSTGNTRPAGTTRDRRRRVPLPDRNTRWNQLVTLLQTLPTWNDTSLHGITYHDTLVNNGKGKAWISQ